MKKHSSYQNYSLHTNDVDKHRCLWYFKFKICLYLFSLFFQRLKAAVHYTVAEICEERGKECDVTFAKQVISALSEATFRYSQMMSRDLELFAK